eukprot:1037372-Rhodomonas_salina.1
MPDLLLEVMASSKAVSRSPTILRIPANSLFRVLPTLCVVYAVSGTERAYGATACPVLSERMVL